MFASIAHSYLFQLGEWLAKYSFHQNVTKFLLITLDKHIFQEEKFKQIHQVKMFLKNLMDARLSQSATAAQVWALASVNVYLVLFQFAVHAPVAHKNRHYERKRLATLYEIKNNYSRVIIVIYNSQTNKMTKLSAE